MAKNFREVFYFLLPSRFTTGEGEKVLYSLALMKDMLLTRARLALEARFPSRAGASAVEYTGIDRGIRRGRSETLAHYAERLRGWRNPRGHKVRGNAFALLEQVAEYWGPENVHAFTLDARGRVRDRDFDGTETASQLDSEWYWDQLPSPPHSYRFWLYLEPAPALGIEHAPAFGDPELWGGSINAPDYCIGLVGCTPKDITAMRQLFRGRPWKPAGTRAEWLVFTPDGTRPVTNGDYGAWSKNVGGTQVAARDSDYRYVSLTPEANNTYAGNPDNWPDLVTLPGGTTYGGDPENYPATVTLPSGRVYAGNPDRYPKKVRLFDDGDAPSAVGS